MAARVLRRKDFDNFLLTHAMGTNAAGQIIDGVAGGVLLAPMRAGGVRNQRAA
jgi:Na+-transporting methylmalonyl-CoA/oxaloacetate decarboxylase beta subunit